LTDNYEEYERACQKIQKENKAILDEFETWIRAKGVSKATVEKHRYNIDFYVNEFLLYEEAMSTEDGVSEVGMFLGYWFIRKAMWANQSSIKSNAASLKKFYQFMYEQGRIDKGQFDELKVQIKEDMPEWLETLRRFDDLSIEDPEDIWRL
jgi:site-specific recombinase XerD